MNEEQQAQEVRPNGPEPKPEPIMLLEPLGSVVRYSETIGKLVDALAKAQLEYKPILKDLTNPYYNSKYADLSNVIEATRAALAKNGLVIIQHSSVDMDHQRLTLTSRLAHSSGEWTENELTLPAIMVGRDGQKRFDAQTCGAAMTYARRYAYQGLAGVAAELDDDGNSATGINPRQAQQNIASRKIADLEERKPGGVPSLFYSFPEEYNDHYGIVYGEPAIIKQVEQVIRAAGGKWNNRLGVKGAFLVSAESIENLKYTFEQNGVPFKKLDAGTPQATPAEEIPAALEQSIAQAKQSKSATK